MTGTAVGATLGVGQRTVKLLSRPSAPPDRRWNTSACKRPLEIVALLPRLPLRAGLVKVRVPMLAACIGIVGPVEAATIVFPSRNDAPVRMPGVGVHKTRLLISKTAMSIPRTSQPEDKMPPPPNVRTSR